MKGQAMTDTRQALEEAWDKIHPMPELSDIVSRDEFLMAMEVSWPARSRFRRFLDAEAWTDAALMLVPEGFDWSMDNFDGELGKPSAWICKGGPFFNGTGDHPALALAQAALRAKEAGDV